MSDRVRAVAILLSVLLWSPTAPGLLRGDVTAERALLLYGGALVLALTGCALLSGIVRAYAPEPVEPDEAAPTQSAEVPPTDTAAARRRTEDQVPAPSGS